MLQREPPPPIETYMEQMTEVTNTPHNLEQIMGETRFLNAPTILDRLTVTQPSSMTSTSVMMSPSLNETYTRRTNKHQGCVCVCV